mmetsp:Transcript_10920/g.18505  ORF Transcript_10920/g.18505 Transcript_10920/m.18505 type:complete len:80 (+) Transcript_10920:203-442(+)
MHMTEGCQSQDLFLLLETKCKFQLKGMADGLMESAFLLLDVMTWVLTSIRLAHQLTSLTVKQWLLVPDHSLQEHILKDT